MLLMFLKLSRNFLAHGTNAALRSAKSTSISLTEANSHVLDAKAFIVIMSGPSKFLTDNSFVLLILKKKGE